MSDWVLNVQGVAKSYADGAGAIEVLKGASLQVAAGESVAIIGRSGAGKSTLLNILGGLDAPDQGQVQLAGHDLASATEAQLNKIRNQHLGFVYQFHHLLPEFSALENVAMPLRIAGVAKKQAFEQAKQILAKVQLADRVEHRPSMLSGGERQRVAIARALVNSPQCVLMDEPTGNLDEATAQDIQGLMSELASTLGTAFVVVTHSHQLANSMHRAVQLHQGTLQPVSEPIA